MNCINLACSREIPEMLGHTGMPYYCSGDCARTKSNPNAFRSTRKSISTRTPASVILAQQDLADIKAGKPTRGTGSAKYNPITGRTEFTNRSKRTSMWYNYPETDDCVRAMALHYKIPCFDPTDNAEARFHFVRGWAVAKGQKPEVREHILHSLEVSMRMDNIEDAKRTDALALVERTYKRTATHGR
jgi:hypothetical protein